MVARTDNMHRTWRIPVKDQLKPGINRLKVTFFPALAEIRRAAEENPDITYTGGSELLWTGAIRKAHYMFGWDWGPCLPDAGIWRPCRLEFYDSRIGDLRIRQEHRAGEVTVAVTVETGAERMEATLLDPEGGITAEGAAVSGETLRLHVQEPRLWWPNGLGGQPLYTLKVRAVTGDNIEDERTLRLGLRTITVSFRVPDAGFDLMEAIKKAVVYCEEWREKCLVERKSLIFETVYITDFGNDTCRVYRTDPGY